MIFFRLCAERAFCLENTFFVLQASFFLLSFGCLDYVRTCIIFLIFIQTKDKNIVFD